MSASFARDWSSALARSMFTRASMTLLLAAACSPAPAPAGPSSEDLRAYETRLAEREIRARDLEVSQTHDNRLAEHFEDCQRGDPLACVDYAWLLERPYVYPIADFSADDANQRACVLQRQQPCPDLRPAQFDLAAPTLSYQPRGIEYPSDARALGIEGYVDVHVMVTADGQPESVRILKAQPRGFFEASALALARKLRFSPALRGDKPVSAWTKHVIRYCLGRAMPPWPDYFCSLERCRMGAP